MNSDSKAEVKEAVQHMVIHVRPYSWSCSTIFIFAILSRIQKWNSSSNSNVY